MSDEDTTVEDMLAQMGVSKEDADKLTGAGFAAAVEAVAGDAAKRRGVSPERYTEICREARESGGNVGDVIANIYAEEKPAGRSGVDPEKEAKAKSKSMSKVDAEEDYGSGDISREAYEESGHAPTS